MLIGHVGFRLQIILMETRRRARPGQCRKAHFGTMLQRREQPT